MIPFPGESAELDWANVTAGAPFGDEGDAIRFRADSATVTAGDAFVAGFYDSRYLEAGADAVFSIIIETLAGSSGTLSLTGGPDADWSLEDTNASVYDLGDHAVSGASTIVVELPWLNVTDYLAEDVETAVRVECTAGAVVIQQVKLRIWPPDGAPGGWSASPFVQDSQVKVPDISDTPGGQTTGYGTPAEMRAAAAALDTDPLTFLSSNTITSGQVVSSTIDPGDPTNFGTFGATYLARTPGNYTGPGFEEEAWIVPPNEVRGDEDRVIFQPTGDDSFAWVQGVATIVNEADITNGPPGGLFHIDATEVDETYPTGTLFVDFVVGDAFDVRPGVPGVTYSDVSLPEFDATYLLLTVWHDGHFVDVADGGAQLRLSNGITTDEVEFDPLRFLWTPAPYRYWWPTVQVMQPHQIFQRHDHLGAGSASVFDPGTRQSSMVVFGTF